MYVSQDGGEGKGRSGIKMKIGKKLVSIKICRGLLFIGCALDAGKDIGAISDGNIPIVVDN